MIKNNLINCTDCVLTVVGARPHFVKAFSLVRAMEAIQTKHVILHTGQHYDYNMSSLFFEDLHIPKPDINLNVGSGTHAEMTSKMMVGIEKVLFEIRPKAVVVIGDTNSTLAATLAAAKYYIPIIHIEAGVRCGNRYMPEEINRKIIDHTSDYLVTPCVTAVENLKKEGITDGVLNLGDFMYDTFLFAKSILSNRESIIKKYGIESKKYILSTIHREASTQNDEQLISILNTLGSLGEHVLLPMHPRTKSRIVGNGYQLSEDSQLKIVEPVGYIEMLDLLLNARYVVTDSGGLQKEAYWAGVPCVTVMSETTWMETVIEGWNTLVGLDMVKLRESVLKPKPANIQPEIYGLPGAANRLVGLMNWT